jgi:hypothetical protein
MNWLKAFGVNFLKVSQKVAQGVGTFEGLQNSAGLGSVITLALGALSPKAAAVETKAVSELDHFRNVVLLAEGVSQISKTPMDGAAKFNLAAPLFASIVAQSEAAAGHSTGDSELFAKAVQGFTQATVDLLNSRMHVAEQGTLEAAAATQ